MPAHNAAVAPQRPSPLRDETRGRELLLTILFCGLLWAWISPLLDMAGIAGTERGYFVYSAAFLCVLVDLLRVHDLPGWTGKIVLCLGLAKELLLDRRTFGSWLQAYGATALEDASSLLHGRLGDLSGETRVFLFLLGCALLLDVLRSVTAQKAAGGWFALATLAYLLILQWTVGADTNGALIAATAWALAMRAMACLPRLERKYARETRGRGWPLFWPAGSMIAIALVMGVALVATRHADRAVRPVDWSFASRWLADGQGAARTASSPARPADAKEAGFASVSGYSRDDSRLGGGSQPNPAVAFLAKTGQLTYWRGEAKSVYTGKGWTDQPGDRSEMHVYADLPGQETEASLPGKTLVQEILYERSTDGLPLLAGGTILSVRSMIAADGRPIGDGTVEVDPESNTVRLVSPETDLSYVKVRSRIPAASAEQLRNDQGPYPLRVLLIDLQLPQGLPDRVGRLARSITEGLSNNYDKAEAIERYLQTHYRYNRETPDMPAEGEDFVDHFLFGQQEGYCDHFSTAMTVMLRTLGIPARWVKGYAPGEVIGRDADGVYTVRVREADAHSWVEAYFPSVGWVSFEPTPGITDQADAKSADSGASSSSAAPDASSPGSGPAAPSDPPKGAIEASAAAGWMRSGEAGLARAMAAAGAAIKTNGLAALERLDRRIAAGSPMERALAAGALALAAAALAIAVALRRSIRLQVLLGLLAPGRDRRHAVRILNRLWQYVFARCGSIAEGQTLREYVNALDPGRTGRHRQALMDMAILHESLRYGLTAGPLTRSRIKSLWKSISGIRSKS